MSEQFPVSHENENEQNPLQLLKGNTSRRTLLRNSLLGATSVGAATLLVTQTASAASYTAKTSFNLSASAAFEEIMRDENAHVAYLKQALGSAARPKPDFQNLAQPDLAHFVKLSQVFENVGVGAYLLAAPAISSKAVLGAAASILTIEARHAGYLNALIGLPLSTNGAFDKPIPQATIVADVSPFIQSLDGGPNPAAPLMNDTDILNFALLLEYLEATFYDINVPKFF